MKTSNTRMHIILYLIIGLTLLMSNIQAQSGSFAGYWKSTFGHIDLEKKGIRISGIYDDGEVRGTVKGVLSSDGKTVIGKWFEGDLQGKMVLTLQNGKNSFTGRWWRGNSQKAGKWIAVRVNKNRDFSSKNSSSEKFEGSWETNFGKMTLSAEENSLSGQFKGRVNNGTISGSFNQANGQFTGTWFEKGQKGKVVLNLLKGHNGIEGEWWYKDGRYGGLWYGAKILPENPCTSGDCKNGKGILVLNSGERYEGNFKDGAYHGIGATYDDIGRQTLKGLWSNGIYQGRPISGNYEDGIGELEMPSGDIYKGPFKNGDPFGIGEIRYKNGDIYKGKISSGVPNGDGVYTWNYNGDRFEGSFRNGIMHGKGIYHFRNGNRFEGNFLSGLRHGQGTMIWIDGEKYVGAWKNDKATGKGQYIYKNGDQYNGYFIDGQKFDKGIYTFADGRQVSANWRDDEVEFLLTEPTGNSVGAKTHYGSSVEEGTFQGNNYFPVMAKNIQSRREAYLAYQIKENQNRFAKEVGFSYFVIYGAEGLDKRAAKDYVENNLLSSDEGRIRIERVNNPDAKVQKVMSRYRYGLNQTRVHTSKVEYVELGDSVASNSVQ